MAENLNFYLRSVKDAVNREYDYIIVGIYLFRSHPISFFLTRTPGGGVSPLPLLLSRTMPAHIRRPQGLWLPHVYQRTPPSPCSFSRPDLRMSTSLRSVSVSSAILPLNPFTMPVAMSGTFGKNFFQPAFEWGFMTVGTRTCQGDALLTLFRFLRVLGPSKAQQRYSILLATVSPFTQFPSCSSFCRQLIVVL
jgi:hypothetical protein